MTALTLLALVFLCSVKKLRDDLRKELRGHARTGFFLFVLFAATIGLSVSAMRKLSKRVVSESTDLSDHEVKTEAALYALDAPRIIPPSFV